MIWQPAYTAPKDGEFILSYWDEEVDIVVWSECLGKWVNQDGTTREVDGWMQIPAIPECSE